MQGLQQILRLSTEGHLLLGNWYILVGHDHQETLAGILVCLKLIVLGVYAGTTAQKEQKLGREMRVVARFCNVDLTLISAHDRGGL